MKKRIATFIFLFLIIFISCKKETFPDYETLKGNWIEINDFLYKDELRFDDEDTLFYLNYFHGLIPARLDTFLYRLDKENERILLTPVSPPDSPEGSFKIRFDKKDNELTVWGLHISIPELPSETKFKKQ